MENQDILDNIYSNYVNIKVTQSNILLGDTEKIESQFTDVVYSPDELNDLIDKRKEIINSDKFVYGEIRKAGVETIYKEISEYDGLDKWNAANGLCNWDSSCAGGSICAKTNYNPSNGCTNFDNLLYAWLTVF